MGRKKSKINWSLANIEIQFVSEDSLALAHYVTGYVTKAEKSHLLDIRDEVSSNETLYSRLWSFGVRSLRSKECGMYEASDILLGDHLPWKIPNSSVDSSRSAT